MKTLRTPTIVLGLLSFAYLALLVWSAPLLPETMATHFGFDGKADGWMSRTTNLALFMALGAGMPLLFIVLSLLTKFVPDRFVNIPRKDYWLAPERRAETCEFVLYSMLWMGCLMVVFLGGVHSLTILANRLSPPHLPMELFAVVMGGFLLGVIAWSIGFYRHFRKTT